MSLTTIDGLDPSVPRPRGRPTKLTKALSKEICDRIALGESVCRIVRDDHMPTEMTIYRWVNDDRDGFGKDYADARIRQAWRYQDQLMDIADDGSNDWITTEDGKERFNAEHYMRSRLRVDTRKWYLAKVLPRVFGEKQVIEHTGDVNVTIKNATEDELRAKLAALTARVAARVTDVEDEAEAGNHDEATDE